MHTHTHTHTLRQRNVNNRNEPHTHTLRERTGTQAYLEKGLGADFYKLPRATAMRTLSEVRGELLLLSANDFLRQRKPARH